MGDKQESTEHEIIMNPEPVTFSDYSDPPKIPAIHVKACTRVLENAAPEDLDKVERDQLRTIRTSTARIDVILTERESVGAVKPWFVGCVNTWGGFYDSLLGSSRVPSSVSDRGERATKLLAVVFPEGIGWVRQDAHAVWGQADRIVAVIVARKLEREIDAIAGEGTFAALKKSTTDLGEAIGTGKTARTLPESKALQEALTQYCREVARYARIHAAKVDENDPRSVERFRRAVAKPIDQFRSRRNGSGELVDPEPPLEPTEPGIEPVAPAEPTPVA